MNIDRLQAKLLAAARAHPPADAVPYAFEQRILAHLRSRPRLDRWSLWAEALWRAAAPCVAVTLLLSLLTLVVARNPGTDTLDAALESTVYAGLAYSGDGW